MVQGIKFMVAYYANVKLKTQDAVKVRDFFVEMGVNDPSHHKHMKKREIIYPYPLIQYKVLHGNPYIIAFMNGINSIYPKLMSLESIKVEDREYTDLDLRIRVVTQKIGYTLEFHKYRFLTPWIAFSRMYYKRNFTFEDEEYKEKILENFLIQNIRSLYKGIGISLDKNIDVKTNLKEVQVSFEGEQMVGFIGEFETNVSLPTLCSIGESISEGMGAITELKMEKVQEDIY